MKIDRAKRIAIIRGANLNKFEMQTYELLAKDFELTAFCLKNNNFDISHINIPIRRLWGLETIIPDFLRRWYQFFFSFILEINQPMFFLQKKLKNFDLVHSADASYYYTYQAAKAKRRYGFKLVIIQAENIPFLFGKNRLAKRRIQLVFQKVDLILALSQRAKEALLLQGVEESKIRVIPFGLDTRKFYPEPKNKELMLRHNIHPEDIVILFVGRFSLGKGVFELLYAAKKILHDQELKIQSIKFLFVGSGKKGRKLREEMIFLNLVKYIQVLPEVPYEMMPKIYNLSDIFVLPSNPTKFNREQFGMVLIESMSCGKAVLSTLCGSIPEVIGDAGILVQPFDHFSLYLALKKLILDQRLREELGQIARARVLKYFDVEVVARQIKAAYDSL